MARSFADLHLPLARFFRSRRLRRFAQSFNLDRQTRVLDLGGAEYYWPWLEVRPRVTVANFEERDLKKVDLDWVRADGRRLPFRDCAFDVVYCNSVLEHLPDEASRDALAREVARVGRGYSVQTPNRWFPVDAHTLTPAFHFLPKRWQSRLARNFTLWGRLQRPTLAEARGFVENICLLTARDLQRLFPDAVIERERFLGLTKSVIAVRQQLR
ncbi:MAG: class I SAM-dependent methyltransferase [Acidobacteriia bacterium]|nr:class I SAM-dependent methyltransferase [Terriglobia bacterium]MYG04451.1 class I SAM-dependent methyltransferase [Terriglobia bacterium]MYK11124.1 class I SAM-dependent methyltransferase [Terriglobia bacterium]